MGEVLVVGGEFADARFQAPARGWTMERFAPFVPQLRGRAQDLGGAHDGDDLHRVGTLPVGRTGPVRCLTPGYRRAQGGLQPHGPGEGIPGGAKCEQGWRRGGKGQHG
jgi:hypothetical protein